MAPRARGKRKVVLVAFERMQILGVVGPAEVLDAATQVLDAATQARASVTPTLGRGRGGYELSIATLGGKPVRTSSGVRIEADVALAHVRPREVDTLIVGGSMRPDRDGEDPRLRAAIARISEGARRTCSVCTGAFMLAGAGLLDGRAATTHWAFCDELARRHPRVGVAPDRIFVRDGHVTTSAGATAGMDLALALVEEDHGAEVARAVARWTVMFLQRPGGQSQFSERLAMPARLAEPLRAVLDAVVAEPAADHSLSALARRAALSERHFRRVFLEQTGTTPARYVERVRVEAARELLEASAEPIESVAARCGFGSPETMRRAFLRVVGVGPSDHRARFRSSTSAAAAA